LRIDKENPVSMVNTVKYYRVCGIAIALVISAALVRAGFASIHDQKHLGQTQAGLISDGIKLQK